jgi:hypothetical protein
VDSFQALENVGAFPHAQVESGSYAAQPGAGRGFAHDLHGRTGPNTIRARMMLETTITTSIQISVLSDIRAPADQALQHSRVLSESCVTVPEKSNHQARQN